MWSSKYEDAERRCAAVGPPVGWCIACHTCKWRSPTLPGAPYSGGACVLPRCCTNPNHRVHDLRILCDYCQPPPLDLKPEPVEPLIRELRRRKPFCERCGKRKPDDPNLHHVCAASGH